MKKKLILVLISAVAVAIIAFFLYFIIKDIAARSDTGETFIPEDINIDEIESDSEFAQTIPEYRILFTGLLDEDLEITFSNILDRYGRSIKTFDAKGVRSDGEEVEIEFTGIRLGDIFDDLSIKAEAKYVIAYATDLYAADYDIEKIKKEDSYLV